jgi:hypothetical protein
MEWWQISAVKSFITLAPGGINWQLIYPNCPNVSEAQFYVTLTPGVNVIKLLHFVTDNEA